MHWHYIPDTRRSHPLHLHPPFHLHLYPPTLSAHAASWDLPRNPNNGNQCRCILVFFIPLKLLPHICAVIRASGCSFFSSLKRYAIFCQWTQFIILRNDFRKIFPKYPSQFLKRPRKKAHFMLLYIKCAIYHSILLSIWLIPSVQLHTEEGFLSPPECLQSDPEASCTLPCPIPSN